MTAAEKQRIKLTHAVSNRAVMHGARKRVVALDQDTDDNSLAALAGRQKDAHHSGFNLNKEHRRLVAALDDAKAALTTVHEELAAQRSRNSATKEQIRSLDDELLNANIECDIAQKAVVALQPRHAALVKKLEAIEAEYAANEKKLLARPAAVAEIEKATEKIRDDLAELSALSLKVEVELEDAKAEAKKLNTRLVVAVELDSKKQGIKETEKRIELLQQTLQKGKAVHASLESIKVDKSRFKDLSAAVRDAKADLDDAKKVSREEVVALVGELEKLQTKTATLESELKQAQSAAIQAEVQSTPDQSLKPNLEKAVKEAVTELESSKGYVAELEQALASREEDVAKSETALREAAAQLELQGSREQAIDTFERLLQTTDLLSAESAGRAEMAQALRSLSAAVRSLPELTSVALANVDDSAQTLDVLCSLNQQGTGELAALELEIRRLEARHRELEQTGTPTSSRLSTPTDARYSLYASPTGNKTFYSPKPVAQVDKVLENSKNLTEGGFQLREDELAMFDELLAC